MHFILYKYAINSKICSKLHQAGLNFMLHLFFKNNRSHVLHWYYLVSLRFLKKIPSRKFSSPSFLQTSLINFWLFFWPSFSLLPPHLVLQTREYLEGHKNLTKPSVVICSSLAHSWTSLNYMCKVKLINTWR